MAEDQPIRVVVEVASPEVVSRLEAANKALSDRITSLEARQNAQHDTLYRLLDRFADLQRSFREKIKK